VWTWSALDYAEEDGPSREELFCTKFKTTEFAQEFKKQYDDARAINAGKQGAPSSSDSKSKNKSREIKTEARADTKSSSSSPTTSSDLQSYETRALTAEKLLRTINQRLAEVENQLGLTAISERKSQPPLKLGYWAIRGLAQPIRLLLTYLNVPFTETRYDGKNRDNWLKEKHTLGLQFPNLPWLVDGETKITQSHAILNYVTRSYGPHLSGSSIVAQAEVDTLLGVAVDFREKFTSLCYNSNYAQLVGNFQSEYLPSILKQLSTYLQSKGNVYFTGSKLTVADFIFYEVLDQNRIMTPKAYEPVPNLTAFLNRFEQLPRISTYLKSKEFISRPINNVMAQFK